jgi:hypothetical protein
MGIGGDELRHQEGITLCLNVRQRHINEPPLRACFIAGERREGTVGERHLINIHLFRISKPNSPRN